MLTQTVLAMMLASQVSAAWAVPCLAWERMMLHLGGEAPQADSLQLSLN
jgi:hypothetical protein